MTTREDGTTPFLPPAGCVQHPTVVDTLVHVLLSESSLQTPWISFRITTMLALARKCILPEELQQNPHQHCLQKNRCNGCNRHHHRCYCHTIACYTNACGSSATHPCAIQAMRELPTLSPQTQSQHKTIRITIYMRIQTHTSAYKHTRATTHALATTYTRTTASLIRFPPERLSSYLDRQSHVMSA